jgi:PD-(D/E)XK nuclease superfamily protein
MTPATFTGSTASYLFTEAPSGASVPAKTSAPDASGSTAAPAVMVPDAPEITLSPSSVATFAYDCQVKFLYRKLLELPEAIDSGRALGSAVHRALAENFRDKLETHEDLPTDGVIAIYRNALEEELERAELQPDENAYELSDTGEALVRVYMDQAAPLIQPRAVEMPVAGVIGGVAVHGYVDLLDVDGRVIDIKTAAKKPSKLSAANRLQLATYTMLAPGASGEVRLDTVTKTKTVALHQQSATITPADREATARLYSLTRDAIASGLFIPNRASFLCSRKHCGFWERCISEYGGSVE